MTTSPAEDWEHRAYFAQIARGVGIAELWVADAVQEMALEVWRSQSPHWKAVARHTAIDFSRQYGRHRRDGSIRETRSIDEPPEIGDGHWTYHKQEVALGLDIEDKTIHDPWPVIDRVLDFPLALSQLTPTQRKHLFNRESGMSHDTLRYQARKKLRKLCA